ncbi:NUDIX domain-containing protein [Peterkaempfera bronchialis]|uniref:NUDIX domain-containing protein n=1 Tax=Peterkaempfera bronchialis TaxID=2126346 RepID=UPI003C2DD716
MTAEAVGEETGGDRPATTWDGLPVAADLPYGAAVVVRRPAGGAFEYLLLHRAHQGAQYEGDWAWTPPSGARQPGEPLFPGALRELQEEAGLVGLTVDAVDLSGQWALYLAEVAEHAVALIDPEHDRYAWTTAEEALRRCAPDTVRENLRRTAVLPPVRIAFDQALRERGRTVHALRVDDAECGSFGYTVSGADHGGGGRAELDWTVGESVHGVPGLLTRALWRHLCEVLTVAEPGVAQVAVEAGSAVDRRAALAAGFLPTGGDGSGSLLTLDVRRVFGG